MCVDKIVFVCVKNLINTGAKVIKFESGINLAQEPILIKNCGNETCKKSDVKLLVCHGCRLQFYCGIGCQKADWPRHKKVCQLSKDCSNKEYKPEQIQKVNLISSMKEIKPMPIPGLRLIENFISDDFHDRFIEQMNKGIPEKNHGHYDGYEFKDYEAFDKVFYPLISDVFSKLKKLDYFDSEKKPLKLACTLVGYEKDGFITPHIDSPLLSGGTVVVISFNSPVVVNFYSHKKTDKQQHKIFIPPKSMYSIADEARDKWLHAILSDENTYNSKEFARGKRYAILLTPPGPFSNSELLDY